MIRWTYGYLMLKFGDGPLIHLSLGSLNAHVFGFNSFFCYGWNCFGLCFSILYFSFKLCLGGVNECYAGGYGMYGGVHLVMDIEFIFSCSNYDIVFL